jgi:Suppressor of fused protein (SUFU)
MPDEAEFSEGGQPIYRHEDKDRDWTPAESVSEAGYKALEAHYQKHLGGNSTVWHELVSDLVHIDVYMHAPTPERDYTVLTTIGMSALPMTTPPGAEDLRFAELMIALPASWPLTQEAFENEDHYWPVRWLKQLARLPHEYDTWLAFGHTIPNSDPPEPLASNTALSGVVLLPPVRFGEEFTTATLEDGSSVHIWAVIPLYPEEMELKLREGVEALFPGFDQHKVSELLDINRPNVARPNKKPGLLNKLFKK